jgi:tetratricopeptide (TPR) repeat protein
MKLLFLLLVTAIIGFGVYIVTSKWFRGNKKKKSSDWKPLGISLAVVLLLLSLIGYGIYLSDHQPDLQCGVSHPATSKPPTNLTTAMDYFARGNYAYDIGDCQQAIAAYTKAISLNPSYAQAYNNRAYTNMRMRNYKDALPDLDKAIQQNPNYIQALMNRGDIHNYYYQINRQAAIADYKRVIDLTDSSMRQQTSVCGHLFLAKHNGWTLGAFIGYFTGEWASCK